MQGNVRGQSGGGFDIQGIWNEYKVATGENISAGDFVEYIDKKTAEITSEAYTGNTISAVALSEDKVFIAHSYNSSNNCLYGVICIISNVTITVGIDTVISTSAYAGNTISAVKLSENKVFIAHSINSSYNRLYGIVCTISGTDITKGTDTAISTTSNTGNTISAVTLSENKVFIAHSYNNTASSGNYFLYGIICTISGTNITKGTDTAISTTLNTGNTISAVTLSENKVFIAHIYSTTFYLYGTVCTISDTTITIDITRQLSNISYAGMVISAVKLSENKVFIAHSYSRDFCLYGLVYIIGGLVGTDTVINTTIRTGNRISAVKLSENKVFVGHSYSSDNYLYMIVCEISSFTITVGVDTQLNTNSYTGWAISAVKLSENKVFIAHSFYNSISYILHGTVNCLIPEICKVISSSQTINGVAQSSGSVGENVKVIEPNFN